MGSGGFFSAASVLVLLRHCHISVTVSLKAKASFVNLGSYPTLVKVVLCNGVNWSTWCHLDGRFHHHRIPIHQERSSVITTNNKVSIFPDRATVEGRLSYQVVTVQLGAEAGRELQVHSHVAATMFGCHCQLGCHKKDDNAPMQMFLSLVKGRRV